MKGGAIMFGWFKSRRVPSPSADEAKADRVLSLLARAIAEVHPDRFPFPDDAALVAQPYLASLNISLGDTFSEQFKAVRFDDVVERAAELDGTGLLTKLMTTISADPVIMPIYLAALHERHGTLKKDEVRRQAELLLTYLGGSR
jgi:hypothetical protein